jgi:hypothetical protein
MMSFPVGSNIFLRDLVDESHLNGLRGTIKSGWRGDQQEVYVVDANIHGHPEIMYIKPVNLRYEPRDVESLTVSEMRGIMRVLFDWRGSDDGDDDGDGAPEWSSMDKDELRCYARQNIEDLLPKDASIPVEEQIAELVARSNELSRSAGSMGNQLLPGDITEVRDLANAPQYNGRRGIVLGGPDPDQNGNLRYQIRLYDGKGKVLQVKASNLLLCRKEE